jgi:copper chaperone CopZ
MKTIYLLEGLSCAHCANKIETAICKLEGVTSATVNFVTQRLTLEFDEDHQSEVIANSERIVKKTEPDVKLKQLLVSRKK